MWAWMCRPEQQNEILLLNFVVVGIEMEKWKGKTKNVRPPLPFVRAVECENCWKCHAWQCFEFLKQIIRARTTTGCGHSLEIGMNWSKISRTSSSQTWFLSFFLKLSGYMVTKAPLSSRKWCRRTLVDTLSVCVWVDALSHDRIWLGSPLLWLIECNLFPTESNTKRRQRDQIQSSFVHEAYIYVLGMFVHSSCLMSFISHALSIDHFRSIVFTELILTVSASSTYLLCRDLVYFHFNRASTKPFMFGWFLFFIRWDGMEWGCWDVVSGGWCEWWGKHLRTK